MDKWRVIKRKDDEGNHCIYLQKGSDQETRELYEYVEPDVMASLPQQYADYVAGAEEEAASRNEEADDDD